MSRYKEDPIAILYRRMEMNQATQLICLLQGYEYVK